jgi:hypothetical protein
MGYALDDPPYSPDLAPSDFQFVLHLKKHLAEKKFEDDDEVQEARRSRHVVQRAGGRLL